MGGKREQKEKEQHIIEAWNEVGFILMHPCILRNLQVTTSTREVGEVSEYIVLWIPMSEVVSLILCHMKPVSE
jgi:hypothetical protein